MYSFRKSITIQFLITILIFFNYQKTVNGFGINLIKLGEDDVSQVVCSMALLRKYFVSGESLSGSVLYVSLTTASIHTQKRLLEAINIMNDYPWTIVIRNPKNLKPIGDENIVLHEKPQCYFVVIENLEDEDLEDIFEDWKTTINWNPLAQFVVYLSSVEETDEEMTELMIEILLSFMNKKIFNVNVIGQSEENGFYYGKTAFPYHPDNNCGNRVISIEILDVCDYHIGERESQNDNGDAGDDEFEEEDDENDGNGENDEEGEIDGEVGNDGEDGNGGGDGNDGGDGNNGEDGNDDEGGNGDEGGNDGQGGNDPEDGNNGEVGNDDEGGNGDEGGNDGQGGNDREDGNNGEGGNDGEGGNGGKGANDGEDGNDGEVGYNGEGQNDESGNNEGNGEVGDDAEIGKEENGKDHEKGEDQKSFRDENDGKVDSEGEKINDRNNEDQSKVEGKNDEKINSDDEILSEDKEEDDQENSYDEAERYKESKNIGAANRNVKKQDFFQDRKKMRPYVKIKKGLRNLQISRKKSHVYSKKKKSSQKKSYKEKVYRKPHHHNFPQLQATQVETFKKTSHELPKFMRHEEEENYADVNEENNTTTKSTNNEPQFFFEEIFRALFLDKFPKDLSGCPLAAAYRAWEPFIFSEQSDSTPNFDSYDNNSESSNFSNTESPSDKNEGDHDRTGFHFDGLSEFATEVAPSIENERENQLSGIEYQLLQTIAERLHINIDLQLENSNLYHLFQELIDGDIEMVIGGIDEDPSMSQYVSTTIPYLQDDLTWCVAKARRSYSLFNFLASFSTIVWIVTFLYMLVVSLTITWLQPILKIETKYMHGFYSVMFRVFGNVFSQSMAMTLRRKPLRLIFLSTFFMGFIIMNLYQSFLISTLTTPQSAYQIKKIEEIYKHRMIIKGSVDNVRHLNKGGETFKYIREKFQMCYNIEECLMEAAENENIAVAVSRQHTFYNPLIPRNRLYCFDRNENVYIYLVTMLLPKKFHLLHKINPVIQHVIESGHLQKWARDLDMRRRIREGQSHAHENKFRSLTLNQVIGTFVFTSALLCISCMILMLECCVYQRATTRRYRRRLKIVKFLHRQFLRA